MRLMGKLWPARRGMESKRARGLYALRRARVLGVAALLTVSCGSARASDALRTVGDVLTVALPGTAAGLALARGDRDGAFQLGKSLAATVAVTFVLKWTVAEKRPNGEPHSFPSGHSSVSFCSAEFLRERYGWEYGVPAYAAASFVGYSRVESKRHYVHDVLAGAAIGMLSSRLLTRPLHGWHAALEAGEGRASLVLTRAW